MRKKRKENGNVNKKGKKLSESMYQLDVNKEVEKKKKEKKSAQL